MNKLRNLLLWLVIAGYMFVALSFVRKEGTGLKCTGIGVWIRDSLERQFVVPRDITGLLEQPGDSIRGRSFSDLDLSVLEAKLRSDPAIRTAEIYATIDGELRVEVSQRVPIARIIDRDMHQYYVDGRGCCIPVSHRFSERVLVMNGNIGGALHEAGSLDGMPEGKAKTGMKELLELAGYLYADPFLRAQIEQIYVNGRGELEMVPRLGAHIILFGDPLDYRRKLFKLEAVYREGFRYRGWNQYETINLKYRNQVICTKR